ncbi:MAG: hypothetical protein R3Y54_04585 [Eubacteriales bacterium]
MKAYVLHMKSLIIYYKRIQPKKVTKSWRDKLKIRKKKQEICIKILKEIEVPAIVIEVHREKEDLLKEVWEIYHKEVMVLTKKLFCKYQMELPEYAYVWYEPNLAELLGRHITEWSYEFLRFVKGQQPFTDTIYLLVKNETEYISFAKDLTKDCNEFVLITCDVEMEIWEDFISDTYEEHGLMVRIGTMLPSIQHRVQNRYRKEYAPILYDFIMEENVEWRNIPKDTIYIDFHPSRRKSSMITSNRKDITYMTYGNYLDIIVENGYNILV